MREWRRLTFLAALLAACTDTGSTQQETDGGPPEEPDAAEVIKACNVTADCPIGHTCVGGLCVRNELVLDKGGCFSNADCPTGATCYPFTGECFPKPDAGEITQETPDSGPPPTCFDGQL